MTKKDVENTSTDKKQCNLFEVLFRDLIAVTSFSIAVGIVVEPYLPFAYYYFIAMLCLCLMLIMQCIYRKKQKHIDSFATIISWIVNKAIIPLPKRYRASVNNHMKIIVNCASLAIIAIMVILFLSSNFYYESAANHMVVSDVPRRTGLLGEESISARLSINNGGFGWGLQDVEYRMRPVRGDVYTTRNSRRMLFSGRLFSNRTLRFNHEFSRDEDYLLSIFVNGEPLHFHINGVPSSNDTNMNIRLRAR